jgi:hypothetical protein
LRPEQTAISEEDPNIEAWGKSYGDRIRPAGAGGASFLENGSD